MSARTAPVCALGAVLALVVVGCGGGGPSTETKFKQGYAAERTSLNKIVAELRGVIAGAASSSDAALLGRFNALEPRYRAELDKLDMLKPPDNLKAAFRAVQTPSRTVDTDLMKIAAALAAHDAKAATSASADLNRDGEALASASQRLRRRLGLA